MLKSLIRLSQWHCQWLLGWSDLPPIFYHRYQIYVKNKKKQFFDWYVCLQKIKKKPQKFFLLLQTNV